MSQVYRAGSRARQTAETVSGRRARSSGVKRCTIVDAGAVLLFVPQRQHVETTAKAVLEAIALEQQYSPDRSVDHLTVDLNAAEVAACIEAIDQQLGPNSTLAECVRRGIAVHHGRLPWQVRQPMEKFIGSGYAQIIVATTTLSAGVNLPIRSVLVKGLWQGSGDQVDALTFWNICGTAGRGMKEIEGQILFFMDLNREQWQIVRDRKYNLNLIEKPNAESIMGVLYLLLRTLKRHWLEQIPEISFEGMCERLANDDFSWMNGDDVEGMKAWFRLLDDQLFALLSESLEDGELADTLESVLADSLLSVQLASRPIQGVDLAAASRAISARMDYVRSRIPERVQRDRFYKLGLPIEDCLQLHGSLDELTAMLVEFAHWGEWDTEARSDWVSKFVKWAVTLPFAQAIEEEVDALIRLAVEFMRGASLPELATDPQISAHWETPQEIGAEIEAFCGFRLSWLANAVATYVQETATEDVLIPTIAAALPAMFKYGTMHPRATALAPFLDNDPRLAEELAAVCPVPYGDNAVFMWFRGISLEDLLEQGIEKTRAERMLNSRNRIFRDSALVDPEPEATCLLEVIHSPRPLEDHQSINAMLKPDNNGPLIELFRHDGELIGQFRPIDHPILDDWFNWIRLALSFTANEGHPRLSWQKVS